MDDMRELITVEAFNRGIIIAAVAWPTVCLLVAAIAHFRRRPRALVLGIAWALLGPIILGLWRFYSWMVRVEPETGYVGLHKVSVFAINLLVFVLVGVALGLLFARLCRRPGPSQDR